MANCKLLIPFILTWEGGYVNNPADKGGPTNKGVTLTTFRQYYGASKTVDDLKKITDEQWGHIFKTGYWDKCKADQISSQSIANIVVDWAYMSGVSTAIKGVQRLLGCKDDGIIGPKTLAAINGYRGQMQLFYDIQRTRMDFYYNLVAKRPQNRVFLKGWLNRLNALKWEG